MELGISCLIAKIILDIVFSFVDSFTDKGSKFKVVSFMGKVAMSNYKSF